MSGFLIILDYTPKWRKTTQKAAPIGAAFVVVGLISVINAEPFELCQDFTRPGFAFPESDFPVCFVEIAVSGAGYQIANHTRFVFVSFR
jgi:hypothetical protein